MGTRIEQVTVPDGTFAAHVAVPDEPNGAGLVLIQEIFGVGSYITAVADRLAAAGYAVAAPDLFWRIAPGHAAEHDEAGMADSMALMGRFDFDVSIADSLATLDHVRALPEVTGSVGAIGFCLGGGVVTAMAIAGGADGPDAVVSYYGSAVPGMVDDFGAIVVPTLFHFGGDDPFMPEGGLDRVREAVPGNARLTLNVEEGAGHAFDNHEAAVFHDPDAAARAWALTTSFLAEHLTGG